MSAAPTVESSRVPASLPSRYCYVCGLEGGLLYQGVEDRLWGVSGTWNFRRCPASECGLVWIDPRPVADDIPRLYENYLTHDRPTPRQERQDLLRVRILESGLGFQRISKDRRFDLLGWLLSRVGFVRDYVAGSIMWISPECKGRLLDFGCGGCGLLTRMRDFGWEVYGVEQDPIALSLARQQLALDVRSSLAEFPEPEFDLITLSHVIEHVPDPVATLKDCAKRLRKGGHLILATPNIQSWGHQYFGKNWVALDPPRHLMLFSLQNLSVCVERAGLRVEDLRTSAFSGSFVWSRSWSIRKFGVLSGQKDAVRLRSKLAGVVFQAVEHTLLSNNSGEDIVLFAKRD